LLRSAQRFSKRISGSIVHTYVLFVQVSRENRQTAASDQLLADYLQKWMIVRSSALLRGRPRILPYGRNFHTSAANVA
jgi:hypothetical protein